MTGDFVPADRARELGLINRVVPQADLGAATMALARQIARSLGGDIWLSHPGNPGAELCGAEFIARLPAVMTEEVP